MLSIRDSLRLLSRTVRGVLPVVLVVSSVFCAPLESPCCAQCDTITWQLKDNQGPTARWRHAVAVDTDRNVLVLFGGDTGETDTWEYNLVTGAWTQRFTPTSPSRRGGHAMVYDRVRHVVVLTGGGFGSATSDVWEYDGVAGTWTRSTVSLPQVRSGHAMAYDAARETIVLYGGVAAGTAGDVDVLERNSTSSDWVVRSPASTPGPQTGHAMAYDVSRGRTVLADSRSNSTGLVNVYEWDGAAGTWSFPSFSAGPDPRLNPTLVYDASRSRCVLMGGEAQSDTWDYDGVAWTRRLNISPGGRDEHAAAYDPINQTVLLHGGLLNSSSPQRDLLEYDGVANTWTMVWSRLTPSPRFLTPTAYDEVGEKTVMYGGGLMTRPGIVQQVGGGTFMFDGVNWTTPTMTGTPPTMWQGSLVYDSDRRAMILHGGLLGSGGTTASRQTWELTLATNTWSDRTIQPSSPSGQRRLHSAAYDRLRHRMVVYGGLNELTVRLGDTWLYDGVTNTWTIVPPGPENPGLRSEAGMAFDEARGVTVMFGGFVGTGTTFDGTTWEWDGSAWSNVTPTTGSSPSPRIRPAMFYDSDRQKVVLMGGINSTSGSAIPLTGAWEFDGVQWSPIPQATSPQPIARYDSSVAYDRARGRVVHFGGKATANNIYASGQTWEAVIPATPTFTIACARSEPIGSFVTLTNVRVANTVDTINSTASASITLEDGTGALTVFGSNAMIQSILTEAANGNVLSTISGTTALSASTSGVFEIINVTNVASSGVFEAPSVTQVTASDFLNGSPIPEALESRIVRVENYVFEQSGPWVYTNNNGFLNDGVLVRLPTTAVASALNAQLGGIPTDEPVRVVGVFTQFDNTAPFDSGYEIEMTAIEQYCDSIDFNDDGLFPDTQDIGDFLSVFGGSACPTGTCRDIDFNNDGLFPDTLDIDSLLSVFSGGACL